MKAEPTSENAEWHVEEPHGIPSGDQVAIDLVDCLEETDEDWVIV